MSGKKHRFDRDLWYRANNEREWQQPIRYRTGHAGEGDPEGGSAKRRPYGRCRPGFSHEISPPSPRHQGAPGERHRRPGEGDIISSRGSCDVVIGLNGLNYSLSKKCKQCHKSVTAFQYLSVVFKKKNLISKIRIFRNANQPGCSIKCLIILMI